MHATDVFIVDASPNEREDLVPLLEESFEGIYLWHARRTLKDIEVVKVATDADKNKLGLVMLKDLDKALGYVYYVAVARNFRLKGVGGKLLDYSLDYFFHRGKQEVLSSVEEDNYPSIELFRSRGFEEITMKELSKRYGRMRANYLRMKMWVVPGEQIWARKVSPSLNDDSTS
jgi:ribosomal protein S18 acetylase RimI-like enzyme